MNVDAIKARLISLGFEAQVEEKLMGQICFGKTSFDLRFDKTVGEDGCTFFAHVQLLENSYMVPYYHAHFRKGFVLPGSLAALDKRMASFNWKQMAHSLAIVGFFMDIQVLQDAFTLLREIAKMPDAPLLLYKYWAGTSFESLVPDVVAYKNRYELSQRFYVSEEHQPITGDEALRFLQNRWLEKAMQQNRLQQRQADGGNTSESGSKKLKRKRVVKK